MTPYLNALILAFVLASIHVLLVLALIRKFIPNKLSPIAAHLCSGFCMLMFWLGLVLAKVEFDPWLSLCALAFALSAFLFLFGAVYKSLSLRFLLLARKRDGLVSLAELDALVTGLSFTERTQLLCNMGLAVKEGEGFGITHQGIRLAKRLVSARNIFSVRTTGFYQEKH